MWAYGLRNPFTFAVEPVTGRIHINDVGEVTWEEIDVGSAGANYGWPGSEGPDNVAGNIVAPLFTHKHVDAAPAGSGPAASSRARRSRAARSIRRPARSPPTTAAGTTSPTS